MTTIRVVSVNLLHAVVLIGAVAFSALGASTTAKADIVYSLNATFDDGEHVTGTFSFNTYGYLSTLNLTTTGGPGSTLPGTTYAIPGSSSGIIPYAPPPNGFYILPVGDTSYSAELQLIFDHPFGGYGIYNVVGGEFHSSYECANSSLCYTNGTLGAHSVGTVRFVAEGIASAVPEPSTWAMMILGFLGLGFIARRKGMALAAA